MHTDTLADDASLMRLDSDAKTHEFRGGWKPLMAAFFGIAFMAVPYQTMGSFVGPISKALGWNFGQIQLALLGYGTISAIGTLIIGPFCDRLGSRPIVLFAATGFGLTFAALSLTQSRISFYAGYLLLGLMVVGLTPVVFTHTVNQWFVLTQLLQRPGRTRMPSDVPMGQASAAVVDHHIYVQQPKRRRGRRRRNHAQLSPPAHSMAS
jgi:Major Facilitator Superfamily